MEGASRLGCPREPQPGPRRRRGSGSSEPMDAPRREVPEVEAHTPQRGRLASRMALPESEDGTWKEGSVVRVQPDSHLVLLTKSGWGLGDGGFLCPRGLAVWGPRAA